jgi:potassium-dependent mechanosensitive channel
VYATIESAAVVLGAVLAAAVAHYLLVRLARRLPLLIARSIGGEDALARGVHLRWHRPVAWVFVLPKVLVWLAALRVVRTQLPALDMSVQEALVFLRWAVTRPLFSQNGRDYSSLDVVLLPAALGLLWVASSALARLVQASLARSASTRASAPEAVGFLIRYLLAFFGAIVVLQVWGIDPRSIAIAASVLGVGIGFGLQTIANNFISGLLIRLERPVRPGDYVTVDGMTGIVRRVGARSTEIRTIDQVTILVPNSKFLENPVTNWNYGDPVSRLHVPVGVAYGSNVPVVRSALLEVARSHPEVLSDPPPDVQFRGFADSALHFELLVWMRRPSKQNALISDLNYRIDASFRRHDIVVPFPQRDLHVRSPDLDATFQAWLRRDLGETVPLDATLQSPTAIDARAEAVAEAEIEATIGPRVWTDADFDALIGRMRGPDGVTILDRRHLLRSYPKCFVGSEAVDWLVRNEGLTRDEATHVGKLLVDRGEVHHVLDEHTFRDGRLFFRFRVDDPEHTLRRVPTQSVGAPIPKP